LWLKKITAFRFSGAILFLKSFFIAPAFEKTLSDGTLVAGIGRYFSVSL